MNEQCNLTIDLPFIWGKLPQFETIHSSITFYLYFRFSIFKKGLQDVPGRFFNFF